MLYRQPWDLTRHKYVCMYACTYACTHLSHAPIEIIVPPSGHLKTLAPAEFFTNPDPKPWTVKALHLEAAEHGPRVRASGNPDIKRPEGFWCSRSDIPGDTGAFMAAGA